MRERALRLATPVLAVVALILIVSLGGWLLRPPPSLIGVREGLAAGRYDAVETQLRDYLRVFPQDQAAHLMLARTSVDRPDPKPELALEALQGIRPPDPRWAAQAKAIEGEARFWQRRYDAAERAWNEALRLDSRIPEVGWKLLNLYALQGRNDDTRRLALRLFEIEPDPHDRVQLLLQMIRHDAHAIAPDSVVHQLEPVVRANPDDVRSTLALGSALIHEGRAEGGLALLRRAIAAHPDDPDVWDGYLSALGDAGDIAGLAQALGQLPAALADAPRFDAARGRVAAQRGDWASAIRAYRRAWERRPADASLTYRYQLALRNGGRHDEFERLACRLGSIPAAREKLRVLYDRIDALPDVGRAPHPDLYEAVSATLELLGRQDEAQAWLRVARDEPHDTPAQGSGLAASAQP